MFGLLWFLAWFQKKSGKNENEGPSDEFSEKVSGALDASGVKTKKPKETLSVQRAQEIVRKHSPGVEPFEVVGKHYTIPDAQGGFLCGWELSMDDAWIEAANRILGQSLFGKK